MASLPTDDKPVVWMPPAKVEELYAKTAGNKFASINAPTSGARVTKELAVGTAPIQLYSLGTPNGVKVTIFLEELEELGLTTYDAHTINIGAGDQFTSGFVAVNPNSKIPACVEKVEGKKDLMLFESGNICLFYADKYNVFIPTNEQDARKRAEILNWVFWQMGCQGPMTGQFGHFFAYAPAIETGARDYGSSRYGMEVQRLCDVIDKQLEGKDYLVDNEYSLADITCYPWVRLLLSGYVHGASGRTSDDFLGISDKFKNVVRWCDTLSKRPAVIRGVQVNSFTNPHPKPWLVKDDEVKKA